MTAVSGPVADGPVVDEPVVMRAMRWWDVTAAAPVDHACFGLDAWSVETFLSELAEGADRDYVVLENADGELLGYGGTALAGSRADVRTIAVAPSARGEGHGRRLLAHLVEVARERGARRLELEVRADNAPARALYAASGFVVDGRRPGYYRGPDGAARVDAVLMHLALDQLRR